MEHPKRCLEIDPDYKISESVLKRAKIKEDKEKQNTIEKIKEIINREFKSELEQRQKQLELIQQNLTKARKTLHILRYVIVNSYYNKQELQISASDDNVSSSNELSMIDKQSRIHPAVKKLLGNNFTTADLNYSSTRRKRTKQVKYLSNTVTQESDDLSLKQTNIKNEPEQEPQINSDVNNVNVKEENVEELNYNFIRNRKKIKYNIVVGNISKWIVSESKEDKSTHKWMVYLRGPKENPDVSHIIKKVIFYLHPSYKPNDVVELNESPFHLSRRGWGEFPLRIRIYFHCGLNKPIDVVHHLKLDRTYTGRQTLGNETTLELLLYENETDVPDNVTKVELEQPTVLDNTVTVKTEHIEEDTASNSVIKNEETTDNFECHFEHDYCTYDIKEEFLLESMPSTSKEEPLFYNDHSYCLLNFDNSKHTGESSSDFQNITLSDSNEYSTSDVIEETVMDDFNIECPNGNIMNTQSVFTKGYSAKILPDNFQNVATNNGRVITVKKKKKPQQSLLKKVLLKKLPDDSSNLEGNENEKLNANNYEIDVPKDRFKSIQEVLPYLLKRLPMITENANDVYYKCLYPYVVISEEKYKTFTIGKRMSCEWRRAKTVLELIKSANIDGCDEWNTKSVIMYARLHGFTPLTNYARLKNCVSNNKDLFLKYPITQKNTKLKLEPDINVDVVDTFITEPQMTGDNFEKSVINVTDMKNEDLFSFIRHSALDKGVLLKNEEVLPNVFINGAEIVLLQSVKCLAENLIRKSMAVGIMNGNFSEETITAGDLKETLKMRPEFEVIYNRAE